MDKTERFVGNTAVLFLAGAVTAHCVGAYDVAFLMLLVFACCLVVYVVLNNMNKGDPDGRRPL